MATKMRLESLSIVVLVFMTGNLAAQNQILKLYRTEEKGCGDYVYESKEVAHGAAYEDEAKAFKMAHSKENPSTFYIKNTDFAIVLEFIAHLYPGACEYKEIRVQKGSSLEAIRSSYKESYTRYKGLYVTEPKEIAVFEPHIVHKSYPNINARFIPQSENGKQSIAAQFTNTTINTAKSVAIKILTRDINNKTIKQEVFVLKGGEVITRKLGEADSYEINISEPFDFDHPKESVDYFTEKIKNWTKEVIQKKELDKKTTTITGVRG